MKNNLSFFTILTIVLLYQSNAICQLSCTICDTKAWNTPIGDCLSGHTDLDAIEWPMEQLKLTGGFSIQEMMGDPIVHPYDVMPRIDSACSNFSMVFMDVFRKRTADSISKWRDWFLYNKETGFTNSIQQIITAPFSTTLLRKICVKDVNGILLDNVKLLDTVFTNKKNCTEIEYAESNKKITPNREDMDASGIDVIDVVMHQNYVLKRIVLDEFQKQVADINKDGKPTANDLAEFRKVINSESLIEPIGWRFYDVSNWLGRFPEAGIPPYHYRPLLNFADISDSTQIYTFRGFKMGDIDHSYGRDYPLVNILAKDKLLNKGEEYDLVLKVDRPHLLEGFQMDVLKIPEFEILDIDSKLPDFESKFVADLSDRKRIMWYNSDVKDGVSFAKEDTIIVLKLKTNANLKLSDVFKIGTTNRNKIKSINTVYPNYQFGLEWTDLILGTENIDKDAAVFIYPNPANEYIYIKSAEKLSHVSILDLSSRKVSYLDNPDAGLSIATLNQGMYLIEIQTISGKSTIKKLFVER